MLVYPNYAKKYASTIEKSLAEHTEYGAVEKRKSFIIKYTVYYYKFLLLLIKIFRVLHVGEVRKLGF